MFHDETALYKTDFCTEQDLAEGSTRKNSLANQHDLGVQTCGGALKPMTLAINDQRRIKCATLFCMSWSWLISFLVAPDQTTEQWSSWDNNEAFVTCLIDCSFKKYHQYPSFAPVTIITDTRYTWICAVISCSRRQMFVNTFFCEVHNSDEVWSLAQC